MGGVSWGANGVEIQMWRDVLRVRVGRAWDGEEEGRVEMTQV